MTSRRSVLTGAVAAPLLAAAGAGTPDPGLNADLERYVSAGVKNSGGYGDNEVGRWIDAALVDAGYRTERLEFDVPFGEATQAHVLVGDRQVSVLAQAPVVTTGIRGVVARLVDDQSGGSLRGAIALVVLGYGRWSTLTARPIASRIDRAFERGARACVIVTTGPSGEAIALNTPAHAAVERMIVIAAPKDAGPLVEAARSRQSVTLRIAGEVGRRRAFNVIGRVERNAALPWLILSTPRSGWTVCAAERGPGLAVWLQLARWAARSAPQHNVFVLCNSGHEFENLGARNVLAATAPAPERTAFWLHLGANLASRDWHDTPSGLLPLESPDPQRFLLVSDVLLPQARQLFAGQPGLECPYALGAGAAGELAEIVGAGYVRAAGVFGAHKFHHTTRDTLDAAHTGAMATAAGALQGLVQAALQL